jgi:hypothetical protein
LPDVIQQELCDGVEKEVVFTTHDGKVQPTIVINGGPQKRIVKDLCAGDHHPGHKFGELSATAERHHPPQQVR